MSNQNSPSNPTPAPARRTFFAAAAAALATFVLTRRTPVDAQAPAPAQPAPAVPDATLADGIVRKGAPLTTRMRKGTLTPQPLDSMVVLERGDDHNDLRNGTHEVLSLIHEERGTRSYPWTLFACLDTHHIHGDATVLQSRLTKNGAGWSAGVHSEVYVHERAVALGANIEMHNYYTGPDKQAVEAAVK